MASIKKRLDLVFWENAQLHKNNDSIKNVLANSLYYLDQKSFIIDSLKKIISIKPINDTIIITH